TSGDARAAPPSAEAPEESATAPPAVPSRDFAVDVVDAHAQPLAGVRVLLTAIERDEAHVEHAMRGSASSTSDALGQALFEVASASQERLLDHPRSFFRLLAYPDLPG